MKSEEKKNYKKPEKSASMQKKRGFNKDEKFNRNKKSNEKFIKKKKDLFEQEEKPKRVDFSKQVKSKSYNKTSKTDKDLIRLNKYISNSGYCSRREADTLIASGSVTVDGKIVTELGFKISPTALVKVDKQSIKQEKHQYILLNKPKDIITTCYDERGRHTVLDLIKGACKERVYPVGRLDRNTTGLLVLTNDGDFAKKIAHPSSKVKKLYEVTLSRNLKIEDLKEISKGVQLDDDVFVDVDDISYVDGQKNKNIVGIELHSGKYHVVKRIFEKYDYKVVKLDRTKIDMLTKKDLPRGRWRFLTETEIQLLKRF